MHGKEVYVIQGWKITDPATLAQLDIPDHETVIAGEDIRWLPCHLAGEIDFPPDDYWLFDDTRVVFTVFHPDGRFLEGSEATDAKVIKQCRQAWALAIPHAQYSASEHVSP
jgi:uncharacterized protein DUF6879